jgi:DNA-binding SARP family transcriptional activator
MAALLEINLRDGIGIEAPTGPRLRSRPEPAISLSLLGGFELCVNELPVDVISGSQRLLAFLALQERPVLRSYIAGNLWLEKSEDRAAANLRAALWRVRRPGLDLLVASGNQVALSPQVSVDVREALEATRRLLDPAIEPDGLLPAFLLSGDILPDWYEDWVAVERERLRQLRLHALEAVCVKLTRAGRMAEAVDVGLAAVAAEPLRESSHRVLIQAHVAEGNWAEAVRQYEIYRTTLWSELGVSPSAQLEQVMASAMSGADDRPESRRTRG